MISQSRRHGPERPGQRGRPFRLLGEKLRAANAGLAALDSSATSRGARVRDLGVLALLGVALIALNGWLAHWHALPEHPRGFFVTLLLQLAVYGLAAGWLLVRRLPVRAALVVIVFVALAARLAFVAQAPTASDDIYRYVWDGRIQAAGINPYRYTPDDPALTQYRDTAIFPHINRRAVPTIYPPVAQGVFRAIYLLHPDSVAWTRIAFVGFDLLTIVVIAGLLLRLGLRPERVLLYAWHPLLILEIGHSGHVDVVMIFFLILALWARLGDRPWRVGIFLACATLTKFYALLALPALLNPARRRDPRTPIALVATIALAYVPFLAVGKAVFGYLGGYVQEEGIASGARFYPLALIEQIRGVGLPALTLPFGLPALDTARLYVAAVAAIIGLLALWCWLRPLDSPRAIPARILLLCGVFLILTTPTYPWYTLLVLAFVPFVGRRLLIPALLLVSGAEFLYLQWWWSAYGAWFRALAYGGGFLALVVAVLLGLRAANRRRHRLPTVNVGSTAPTTAEPDSLFERFPWLYIVCREWFFRDHTTRIVAALWPSGAPRFGERVLELGCGPGFYARRIARRFAQARVTGLDRSPAQLRHARARSAAQRLDNCHFVVGDARALTDRDGTIDAIVASRLFTILPEREATLEEVYRVLASGGRCFIAEPRSRLWTALPLGALWLAARLTDPFRQRVHGYREPRAATVLTDRSFDTLIRSQPWLTIACWHDRQYHYALCEKSRAVEAVDALAAD